MKKMLITMLAITTALLMFTGCSKKSSWTLTIHNDGHYSVVSAPDVSVGGSFGWQQGQEGEKSSGELTVKNDGEYTLVIMDEDKNEYTITIISKNGKAEIQSDDGISVELKEK